MCALIGNHQPTTRGMVRALSTCGSKINGNYFAFRRTHKDFLTIYRSLSKLQIAVDILEKLNYV